MPFKCYSVRITNSFITFSPHFTINYQLSVVLASDFIRVVTLWSAHRHSSDLKNSSLTFFTTLHYQLPPYIQILLRRLLSHGEVSAKVGVMEFGLYAAHAAVTVAAADAATQTACCCGCKVQRSPRQLVTARISCDTEHRSYFVYSIVRWL